jgi:hypothetical protein
VLQDYDSVCTSDQFALQALFFVAPEIDLYVLVVEMFGHEFIQHIQVPPVVLE